MPRNDDEFDDRPRPRRRPEPNDAADDRPRRRRRRDDDDDYEDDRPRRRNSDASVALGVISLLKGTIALMTSFIPCVGAFAIFAGLIALMIGIIGIVVAKKNQSSMGFPIAGVVVSGLAIIVSGVWITFMAVMATTAATMPPPTFTSAPPATWRDATPTTPDPVTPLPTGKFTTLDLSKYGIRAVIDVPEGTTVKQDYSTALVIAKNLEVRFSTYGDDVVEEKKKARAGGDARLLGEVPDGCYVTTGNPDLFATYSVMKDVTIAGEKMQAKGMTFGGKGKRAEGDLLWAVVRTFRQTDAQKKQEVARAEAIKKLAEVDVSLSGKEVYIRNEQVTDETIKLLASIPDLTKIHFGNAPKLTPAAFKAVAAMPQIQGLELHGERYTNDFLAALNPMPELETLWILSTSISDDGLKAVAGMPKLRQLSLGEGRSMFTDAGVKHLGGLKNLKQLWLTKSGVTSKGLAPLAGMPELQTVGLAETAVDDEGLKVFAGKTKLLNVYLTRTAVHGPGLKNLEGASLDTLMLDQTLLTDDGATALSGLRAIGLYLNGTALTDAGMVSVAKVKGVKSLNLDNTRIGDAGVKHLATIPTLERLEIRSTDVTGATFGDLKACPNLDRLYFANCPVTDAAVPSLIALPKLSSFDPVDTELTDACLKTIAQIPADRRLSMTGSLWNPWQFSAAALKELKTARPNVNVGTGSPAEPSPKELKPLPVAAKLPKADPAAFYKRFEVMPNIDDEAPGKPVIGVYAYSEKLSDADLADLRELKTLKSLSLSGENFTDAGLAHLAGLTNLESISLRSDKITDSGLAILAKMPMLQSVDITSKQVAGDGFTFLKGAKELRSISLSGAVYFPRHLAPFENHPKLETINFGSENDGSPYVAALYAKLPKVTRAYISRGTVKAIKAVAEAKQLRELIVSGGGSYPRLIPARALAPIAGMSNLKELTLQGYVDDRGLAAISTLTGLETLRVDRGEQVTDEGFRHVGKLSNVRFLAIPSSRPTPAGIAALSGLKQMTYLELSVSLVDDAGVAAVLKLPAVSNLKLYAAPRVTDASVPALGAAKTLRSVALTGSGVTLAGVKKLREANPELQVEYPEPEKPEEK